MDALFLGHRCQILFNIFLPAVYMLNSKCEIKINADKRTNLYVFSVISL